MFRSSDFTRSIILSWISQIALFGSMLMIPLYLQNVRGFSALESGLTTLPMAICSMIFMPISGKLFDKLGARPLALTGLSIITNRFVLPIPNWGGYPIGLVLIPIGMMGAGMGLSMMPLNTHVLNSAPRSLSAV